MSKIDALAGFEATLTHHSITSAQINKLNPGKPAEFYALIAFPAAAQSTLWDVLVEKSQAAHNMAQGFSHGIKTNQASGKPIVGVPGDAIMVRASSQYAPEIYDADGSQLDPQNPVHLQTIKSKFHAGSRVRVILSPFAWNFQGKKGVSFNLSGLMIVPGDAPKLSIGGPDVGGAFKQYAQAGAGGSSQNATGNPGGVDVQSTQSQPAGSVNPFQQNNAGAAAQSGNPFA